MQLGLNPDYALESRKSAQALGAPDKFEKGLTTNKVATSFSNSSYTPMSYTSFPCPMHNPGLNHYCFKKNEFETDKLLRHEKQQESASEKNKKLLCRFCKNHITNSDEAISIEGAYTHTFSNPAGYVYTINCYQTAPGCLVAGERTNEFTWFKNYDWQIAFCNSCQEQSGWLFSNENAFYALIADRLLQDT
jgi:hypothetical protein